MLFAAQALRGLIGDTEALSLTLLQWLSAPERPWEINSEIGDLAGELMGPTDRGSEPKPLLSFIRYDARLEKDWLRSACGPEVAARLSADYIADLQRLDRPDLLDEMYRVGEHAAKDASHAERFSDRARSGECMTAKQSKKREKSFNVGVTGHRPNRMPVRQWARIKNDFSEVMAEFEAIHPERRHVLAIRPRRRCGSARRLRRVGSRLVAAGRPGF